MPKTKDKFHNTLPLLAAIIGVIASSLAIVKVVYPTTERDSDRQSPFQIVQTNGEAIDRPPTGERVYVRFDDPGDFETYFRKGSMPHGFSMAQTNGTLEMRKADGVTNGTIDTALRAIADGNLQLRFDLLRSDGWTSGGVELSTPNGKIAIYAAHQNPREKRFPGAMCLYIYLQTPVRNQSWPFFMLAENGEYPREYGITMTRSNDVVELKAEALSLSSRNVPLPAAKVVGRLTGAATFRLFLAQEVTGGPDAVPDVIRFDNLDLRADRIELDRR